MLYYFCPVIMLRNVYLSSILELKLPLLFLSYSHDFSNIFLLVVSIS